MVFVKGALDRVLQMCDSYFSSDGTRKVCFCFNNHNWPFNDYDTNTVFVV